MKRQKTLHRWLNNKRDPAEDASVALDHFLNDKAADNVADSDYIQLNDSSKTVHPHQTTLLNTLAAFGISTEALGQEGSIEQPLQDLLTKEMSCSRYFRWAVLDNFVEKLLQGLILNKQDISQEAIHFCAGMMRQMPSGRSLLLHHAWGLKKMYAARGLVLTTEMVLTKAVKMSITAFLSYRLYAWLQMDNTSNFLELKTLVENNSKKGVTSLVYFLSKFDKQWLYLLLTSPAIVGVLKGLLDTRKSQLLTESAIKQLQEAVNFHTNTLLKKCYLWDDVLRQMIPIPGFSSVSERVQWAEQQVRWDGRIKDEERASLFSNIERLALNGRGLSKINAMQSLAKIVHSLSIKDFQQLQDAGYSQETLLQILRIKTQALNDLKMLSNCARLEPMQEEEQAAMAALQKSLVGTVYATYLLWWLGMGECKYSPLFWSFKLGKLALEGLFIKAVIESILEAIQCPDKKYFSLRSGGFEVRATELTSDCFKEFVRQFRLLDKEESFEPFLAQLNNFDFTEIESIDLTNKGLSSNETIKVLNILKNKKAPIKVLKLMYNRINETMGLSFRSSLQSLDLSDNNIGAGEIKFKLPPSLNSLRLSSNNIGDEGVTGLTLPVSLQILDLSFNNIGDEGIKSLKLPGSLQYLDLSFNNIGDEGVTGLKLSPLLKGLSLAANNLGAEGVKSLKLAVSLQSLDLSKNNISAEGVKGLKLPPSLKDLFLSFNNIGDEGVKWLELPTLLQALDLSTNNISDEGVSALLQKIPKTNLTTIDLDYNPYNATAINPNRIFQQIRQRQTLLKNCQNKLCYAETSLSQDAVQTSGATRAEPSLFFSWFTKPLVKLSEYASDCMSSTLDSLGARLEKVLLRSPSYFPNIRSSEINDWQSSGSVILHQFKTSGSNAWLLSASQATIQLRQPAMTK
jgi:Leucine-rich repeat (LRR) protein